MAREAGRVRRGWVPLFAAIALLSLGGVAAAAATVSFDGAPGRKAPPKRLGGMEMLKFGRDHRTFGRYVTTVNGPTGQLAFSEQVAHLRVKDKKKVGYWRTWSNGYHGDVYWIAPPGATIDLPTGTTAFYFYAEPNDPGRYKVTATTLGASSGAVRVRGKGGAKFFGFIAKDGAVLTSVTVTSTDRAHPHRNPPDPGGFAVGEFGIHQG